MHACIYDLQITCMIIIFAENNIHVELSASFPCWNESMIDTTLSQYDHEYDNLLSRACTCISIM